MFDGYLWQTVNYEIHDKGIVLYFEESTYSLTSKEGLSSGVTEHFILLQLARIKAEESPKGVGKTLHIWRNIAKGFNFIVRWNGEWVTIKFGIILCFFEGHILA